jgi:hypothetical protein
MTVHRTLPVDSARPRRIDGWALALALAWLAGACASGPPTQAPSQVGSSASPSGAVTTQSGGPPLAVMTVDGGGRHEGELGTFVYRGSGTDAPWLPATALDSVAVKPDSRLTVRLGDQGLIGPWSATIAPAGDDQAERAQLLAREGTVGGLRESIELPAPPPGAWVLMADLNYGDGSGSGAYYWLVDVR